MGFFHPKRHNLAMSYDKSNARPMSPPRNLLPCTLVVDDTIVNVWISRGHLHELHSNGVKIYTSKGELHTTTENLK